ncbi:hypothetical protein TRVL_08633 [Trypanosoma vivax]|nr:hypothetical protein TRVL_08633 [Trypanosoma vivax]
MVSVGAVFCERAKAASTPFLRCPVQHDHVRWPADAAPRLRQYPVVLFSIGRRGVKSVVPQGRVASCFEAVSSRLLGAPTLCRLQCVRLPVGLFLVPSLWMVRVCVVFGRLRFCEVEAVAMLFHCFVTRKEG